MKKVNLRMDEHQKYEVVKKLVDTNGNKTRAAVELECTPRHVNRMIEGYKRRGKTFFIHGNRARKPANTISEETKGLIVGLYSNKYLDANYKHFTELLGECEGIHVSCGTVHSLLMEEDLLSPKARKSTKKRVRKKLDALKKSAKSKKEIQIISERILALEDAHPRRPRSAYFGEMLQMDASLHPWFGTFKSQLHIAVDDATGHIVGAHFALQETLQGYYNIFSQILKTYGIPYMFYTDRRTVFEYKQKKSPSVEEDTFTQFSYACHQLGVAIKATSVPQAKGRVERLFQTLQSRLPILLRLAGVTTIDQANAFLNSYIKKHNARFAIPLDTIKSVFEEQPSDEKINLTLAVIANRKVDNGHCIRFNKEYLKPVNDLGAPVYYHKGTHATIIHAFDGNLFACINDTVYSLDTIPSHEITSKNFDFPTHVPDTARKRHIPPMIHPWRKSTFEKFLKNEIRHHDYSFDDLSYSQAAIS